MDDDLPNRNPNFSFQDYWLAGDYLQQDGASPQQLQVSDYLDAGDAYYGFELQADHSSSQSLTSTEKVSGGSADLSASATSMDSNMVGRDKLEVGHRVAFRMKSDLEVIDDGYKWRKYGKKSVKNSPNPRNYYKCSVGGCFVKKRVEKDSEDASYVITTYEGTHNHDNPCSLYRNQMLHRSTNIDHYSLYP